MEQIINKYMDKVNVNLNSAAKTSELFIGQALEQHHPRVVEVSGLINAPKLYLEKRVSEINQKQCMVIVDDAAMSIELTVDEKNHFGDVILGKLKLNPDFLKFSINTGEARDTFELADFIKMNRIHFADKKTPMTLVTALKNLKAKVNNEIELSNNDRGNQRILKDQVLESNIPEAFNLSIAIFKGAEKVIFPVEININASNFGCTLISPTVNDIISESSTEALGKEIEAIQKIAPDIAVLHI